AIGCISSLPLRQQITRIPETVSPLRRAFYDAVESVRIVLRYGMQQQYCAIVQVAHNDVICVLRPPHLVTIPVVICEAPEQGAVTQVVGQPESPFTVLPFGRTQKLHAFAEFLAECPFEAQYLLFRLPVVEGRQAWVVNGMVPDDMAFLDHPPNKVLVFFQVRSRYEKYSFDIMLCQGIEYQGSIAVFVAFIECQVNDAFSRVANPCAAIFLKEFRGARISFWRQIVRPPGYAPPQQFTARSPVRING